MVLHHFSFLHIQPDIKKVLPISFELRRNKYTVPFKKSSYIPCLKIEKFKSVISKPVDLK